MESSIRPVDLSRLAALDEARPQPIPQSPRASAIRQPPSRGQGAVAGGFQPLAAVGRERLTGFFERRRSGGFGETSAFLARRPKQPVPVIVYEGARHGFDIKDAPEVLDIGSGMTVGYQVWAAATGTTIALRSTATIVSLPALFIATPFRGRSPCGLTGLR